MSRTLFPSIISDVKYLSIELAATVIIQEAKFMVKPHDPSFSSEATTIIHDKQHEMTQQKYH